MEDVKCYRHGFEVAENTCRNCGLGFCSECLVYAFGPNKPPYCISCALAASGVRSNAGRSTSASKRDLKRLEKEHKKAVKAKKGEKDKPKVEVAPVAAESAPSEEENPFAWADDPDAGQRVPF